MIANPITIRICSDSNLAVKIVVRARVMKMAIPMYRNFIATGFRFGALKNCRKLVTRIGNTTKAMAIFGGRNKAITETEVVGKPTPRVPLIVPANKKITPTMIPKVKKSKSR